MNEKSDLLKNELLKIKTNFFVNFPIFSGLNPGQLKIIVNHMSITQLEAGETLFNEYDKGNFVCFISEGSLYVIKKSDTTGKEVTLTTLKEGQSIGEMSIIEDLPRSATVRAKEKTTLIILSKSAFELILERYPAIANILLKGISRLLSEYLRKTSKRLADYTPPLS